MTYSTAENTNLLASLTVFHLSVDVYSLARGATRAINKTHGRPGVARGPDIVRELAISLTIDALFSLAERKREIEREATSEEE